MLDYVYQDMPGCNLSNDLLQKIPEHLTVLEMSNVHWSDWGKPTRIIETLHAIGKPPNFSCGELKEYLGSPILTTSYPSVLLR